MHTSGLVVSFEDAPMLAQSARLEMAAAGPFQMGPSQGRSQAVVLEATDPKSAHDWYDWVSGLAGVVNVEIVFVYWADADAEVAHAVA